MTQFSYKVQSTDINTGTMEVLYSREGRADLLVSMRLPYQGETLETVVQMHAPIGEWQRQDAVYEVPENGTVGTAVLITPEPVAEVPIITTTAQPTNPLSQEMIMAQIQKLVAQMNDATV